MKIIIFDYEVFKFDTLLGTLTVDNSQVIKNQMWDLEEMKTFYADHSEDIWIGWNNFDYDNIILDAVMNKRNPYAMSKMIIEQNLRPFSRVPKFNFDLLRNNNEMFSLKQTELISGESIETTEVDFNIDRPLTEEEKRKTEEYNLADLNKTLANFEKFHYLFELRLDIINEFKLPLAKFLNATGTQLAAAVLGAKADPSLEYKPVKPPIYPNLQLKNEKLWKYYLEEGFRKKDYFADSIAQIKSVKKYDKVLLNEIDKIHVGNAELTLGSGGLHYAQKKVYYPKLIYGDISGAYNLVMIYYDLFSRSIPQSGIDLYKYMFTQQKELKKKDPKKRKIYKTILLSVYGAQMNAKTDLYDPYNGLLTPITLQLFVVDLMEKLERLVTFVQVNTDGIMMCPNDWTDEPKIQAIIKEWEDRTKFELKLGYVYDYFARDVNNYVMREEGGELTYKGEVFKNFDMSDAGYSAGVIFNCKNPPIVAKGVIGMLIEGKLPEETVNENKRDLRLFQFPCKKGKYSKLTYDITDVATKFKSQYEIQSPSRAFAWNEPSTTGMVYKHGITKKGPSIAKVAGLPDSVFVYNGEILSDEAIDKISPMIDWQWYTARIIEKINEFLNNEGDSTDESEE